MKRKFVILNTRLNLFAASDIDFTKLGETTLRFPTTDSAKEFMQSCPMCWTCEDVIQEEPNL